ncbi:MAG: Gfo/Idh/MocA family oxidoreductase [Planctomycetota bacterium]
MTPSAAPSPVSSPPPPPGAAPLRVGIVGARRVRQGLGPFVARDLTRLGARVTAVLGTTENSAEIAAAQIEEHTGRRPAALADPETFDAADLDAVCVLSPAGTHLQHVERALARGRHVLCEKPFLWSPERDWSATARRLEEAFAERRLVLAVNAQWPWVLPAFRELTGLDPHGAATLAMGLAPTAPGVQMIGDALPHVLSVAQALRPGLGGAESIRIEHPRPEFLRIRARLFGEEGALEVDAHLDASAKGQPREAWLAIDGVRADRCIRTRDYAMFLRSGAGLVDLPDPMTARLADFLEAVRRVQGGLAGSVDRQISRRAAILDAVARGYEEGFDSSPGSSLPETGL